MIPITWHDIFMAGHFLSFAPIELFSCLSEAIQVLRNTLGGIQVLRNTLGAIQVLRNTFSGNWTPPPH